MRAGYSVARTAEGRPIAASEGEDGLVSLAHDHAIELPNGTWITAGDILLDPQKYHGLHCRDPFEPEYAPPDAQIARIYTVGQRSGPVINSMAHGGTKYALGWGGPVPAAADEFEVVLDDAPEESPVAPSERIRHRIIWDDALGRLPAPEWVVDRVIPHKGLVMLFGAPACAKSFVGLDMAVAIARGIPWQGRRTRQGDVVYIYSEGHSGLQARVAAIRETQGLGSERLGIAFVPQTTQLLDLAQSIKPLAHDIEAAGANPTVIFVDTLHRNTAGADENSAKDMGRALASLDFLREHFKCTVIYIHHTRKGDDAFRGSAVLLGAPDTVLSLRWERAHLTLKCEKQKDAEEFAPIGLTLTPAAGSCVITARTGITSEPGKLSKHEQWARIAGRVVTDVPMTVLDVKDRVREGAPLAWVDETKIKAKTIERDIRRALRDAITAEWIKEDKKGFVRGPKAVPDDLDDLSPEAEAT